MLKSRKGQEGFTLIELLVVVLIIGILAAIAIPAFLGQKKGAQDSNAKSLLRNSAIAMESYFSDNQNFNVAGTSAGVVTAVSLQGVEPNIKWTTSADAPGEGDATVNAKGDNVAVQVTGSGTGYTLFSKSQSGNLFTYVRDATGAVKRCKTAAAADAAWTTDCSPNAW